MVTSAGFSTFDASWRTPSYELLSPYFIAPPNVGASVCASLSSLLDAAYTLLIVYPSLSFFTVRVYLISSPALYSSLSVDSSTVMSFSVLEHTTPVPPVDVVLSASDELFLFPAHPATSPATISGNRTHRTNLPEPLLMPSPPELLSNI